MWDACKKCSPEQHVVKRKAKHPAAELCPRPQDSGPGTALSLVLGGRKVFVSSLDEYCLWEEV